MSKSKHHAMAKSHMAKAMKAHEKAAMHVEAAHSAMAKCGTGKEAMATERKSNVKGNSAKKTNKANQS